MGDEDLSSYLQKNGLDNTVFWKKQLEEKLGVKSKAALDLIAGDMASYYELEKEAKFLVERRALQKILKVDKMGLKEEKEKKTKKKAEKKEKAQEKSAAKKKELRKQEEEVQAILKELEKARSEGKSRHDDRIQKLEGQIRAALNITPESWISNDKSLDELVKNLEARQVVSAKVQAREPLDEGMLLQNGRALNGVLLTKELADQLEDRSRLLEVPEKIVITGAAQAEDKILQFSSSHQEDLYKKTVDVLGHGIAVSSKIPYGGVSASVGVSKSDRNEDEKTHQTNTKEIYSSTAKYSTLQVASYSFENKDLKLSSDAKEELKEVLKRFRIEKNSASVQEACKRFFVEYGSHVNKGPFRFGGSFWWTCSSKGFSREDTATVKNMQSEAISATAGISFAGFGVSTEVSMDKVKASYEGKCTKDTLASTSLQVKIDGGPPEVTDLSLWKSGLVANNSTWIVTNRGKKLVAVWDIIRKNHERELGEIRGVLRSTWEKMSGLKAEQELSSVLKYDPDSVLSEVNEWNENEVLKPRQIKDNLEHLSQVKDDIISKTGNSKIWITEYLSVTPVQDFLELVADSEELEPHLERIKSLMEKLAPLEELGQLDSRLFPSIEEVSDWLYKPGELTTYCNMQRDIVDFESFDSFLQKTIENASTAQLKAEGPLVELSAKSSEILARDVSKGILFLRSYFPRSYDDILITIMVYQHKSSRYGDGVTFKPKAITFASLRSLRQLFSEERKKFDHYSKKKHPIHVQAYLFHLAVELSSDAEKSQLQKLLQHIVGTMKDFQLPIEKELSGVLNEYLHGTSLLIPFQRRLESLMNTPYKVKPSQPTPSKKSKPHSLKNALLTATRQPGVQTGRQSSLFERNPKVKKLFEDLGISELYPKGMQLKHALCIRPESLKLSLNEANPTDPKQLPYLVLHKIMSYDYLCRSDLLKLQKDGENGSRSDDSESDDYEDSDDDNDDKIVSNGEQTASSVARIHPVDSLLALILCSDDFLCQDLLSRLAKCQLAVPFILPDPFTKQLSIPLWAMHSIVKEWKCIEQTGTGSKVVQRTHPIVNYGMPIVSFIRFGKPQRRGQSKSKILNEVISESHYDHFFHRDSPGGQYDLLLGEGIVDMCWYLPAGIPADAFPDAVTFLNLHGDARQHPQQSKFLSQISSMCFVLLNQEDMEYDKQTMEILKKFSTAPGGITILNDVQQKPKTLKKEIPKAHVINLTNKNDSEIKESIRNRIKSKLDKVDDFRSIDECCAVREGNIVVDEDNAHYKEGLSLAVELKAMITSHKAKRPSVKEVMLPLQGKSLWQAWATADKELHRQVHRGDKPSNDYTAEIKAEKAGIREEQLEHLESLSPVMESFIVSLLKLGGSSNSTLRNYFLQCLKLELNNLSRESISGMQLQYQATRKELAKLLVKTDPKEGDKAKSKGEDIGLIKQLKKKMKVLQEDIINASLGLEHLLREFGQIYEAAFQSYAHVGDLSRLPRAAAELLIEGYPLEVMDGDAAHVPREWITAVFKEAVKLLEDPKVFVLSVLGLQSTGKSTMLNTAFGLQFNVSAGRCTRGAFIQLLPLDERLQAQTNCNYVLVVDTEGLRAPELDPLKTQKHDNELATFVIGLANMTLINIYGEVPGDMDDILQTSVHAFLRMNQVKYNPSCQFVHQNAGANLNSELGRAKFTQKLNKFTVDAAREENCHEGQFEVFNDVIQFDDQKDVHHFPGLWKGDPPMAPVNQGYSHCAQMLKYQFIDILEERGRKSDLSLSSFHVKVGDLWNTLLKENFVFSFKNTLEITAYNSLETAYSIWDWKFNENMLEWERLAENAIKVAKPEAVPELVKKKRVELVVYVSKEYGIYKAEMDAFFKGKQSEILVQWQAKFENRLSTLKNELLGHAEKHCAKLGHSRAAISKIEKEQKEFAKIITDKVQDTISSLKLEQEKLNESLEKRKLESAQLKKLLKRKLFTRETLRVYEEQKIITESQKSRIIAVVEACKGQLSESQLSDIMVGGVLATEQAKMILKKAKQTEAELEVEFNAHWQELVDTLPFVSGEDVAVDAEVERKLFDYVRKQGYDGQLIGQMQEKGQSKDLKMWGVYLEFLPEEGEHYHKIETSSWIGRQVEKTYDLFARFFQSKKTKKTKPDPHQIEALNMTDRIFNEARNYLKKLEKKVVEEDTDFNTAYIQELLRIMDKKITEECIAVKDHLIVTPEYRLEIYLTACGHAISKFEMMRDVFKEKNDPRLYLERNIKGPLFAKFKNQYYQTEAEEAIANTLCSHLEEPIKKQVAKKIGRVMATKMMNSEHQHFSSKMALKVRVLTDIYHEKDAFSRCMYYATNVKACLEGWMKYYAIKYCDEIESGNSSRLQATVKDEVAAMIQIVQEKVKLLNKTDVKKWLSAFCEDDTIKTQLGVDLEPEDLLVVNGDESLQELNLNNFKDQIKAGLQKLQKKLDTSFAHIKYETEVAHWQDKPHELRSRKVIGCTAQCPFCGEQCDILHADHSGTKHRVGVHRSNCLAGYRDENSGKLVTGFCPTYVAGNMLFSNKDTNYVYRPYKDYQSINGEYSNWSIPPDKPSDDSSYWKMFIATHNDALASRHNAKPADIPSDWRSIQWPEVEQNLKKVYNL